MASSAAALKEKATPKSKKGKARTTSRSKTKDITLKGKKSDKRKKPAQKLSKAEIDELIVSHQEDGLRMAWKLLNRWRIKLPADDVVSIVGIALCEAGIRFDPSYETSFRTFFFYHLRGVLIKEVTKMINDKNNVGLRSLPGDADGDAYSTYYIDRSNANLIERKTPENIFAERQVGELCQLAIEHLDELEREVIIRFFVKDESIVDIAKELGYCRCHLSRVKNRALKTLSKVLAPIHKATANTGKLPELVGKPAKLRLPPKKAGYTGGRGRRKRSSGE